jgi:hypothetical protein
MWGRDNYKAVDIEYRSFPLSKGTLCYLDTPTGPAARIALRPGLPTERDVIVIHSRFLRITTQTTTIFAAVHITFPHQRWF